MSTPSASSSGWSSQTWTSSGIFRRITFRSWLHSSREAYRQYAHRLCDHSQNDALIASARARGVPIVSGKQMQDWIDGSSFGSINWNSNTLSFTVGVGTGANGLTGMLPIAARITPRLGSFTRGISTVAVTPRNIKGLDYAMFDATSGTYSATYTAVAPMTIAAATARTEQTADAQTATVPGRPTMWRPARSFSARVRIN